MGILKSHALVELTRAFLTGMTNNHVTIHTMLKSAKSRLEPNIPRNRYFENCSGNLSLRLKTWIR